MNKKLAKRHKRQVANERVIMSEPDVRTPEQVRTAREGGRPAAGWRTGSDTRYTTPPRSHVLPAAGGPTKVDV